MIFFFLNHLQQSNLYQLNHVYIYNSLIITLIGALSWIISELFCNEVTKYGHIIWHCLFPFGFYRLILNFDKEIEGLPEKIDN